MSEQLREKLVEILYNGYGEDSIFDREGGFTPRYDQAEEVANQILQVVEEDKAQERPLKR